MSSNRSLAIVPSLLLATAVVFSRLSGNDKSPFIVLLVLAMLALLLLAALVVTVYSWSLHGKAPWLALGTACPLIYAGIVIALSQKGFIDSLTWLGFR